jgi:hypothetical protein
MKYIFDRATIRIAQDAMKSHTAAHPVSVVTDTKPQTDIATNPATAVPHRVM